MIITREYLNQHRTKNGAWTKSQIEALGLEFMPKKGWMKEVIGKELSLDMQIQFEAKKYAKESNTEGKLQGALSNIRSINTGVLVKALRRIENELGNRANDL